MEAGQAAADDVAHGHEFLILNRRPSPAVFSFTGAAGFCRVAGFADRAFNSTVNGCYAIVHHVVERAFGGAVHRSTGPVHPYLTGAAALAALLNKDKGTAFPIAW
ncbi:hypothetical protein GCM10027317_47180 [Massilia agri]